MFFESIKKEFELELSQVDDVIKSGLVSNVDLINDVTNYIISHGGKRIRPIVTILLSKLLGYSGNKHIISAGVIELIHTATLLHDDVVDVSEKRRGKMTVNSNWGNKEAILVGDFLYTRSFQIVLNVEDFRVLKVISDSANIMAEGESMQLVNKRNFEISEDAYFEIIKRKTAQLFSAASSISSIITNSEFDIYNSVYNYGIHLGLAYQLIDDALDFLNDNSKFGKNVGDDIFEGIFTLPLIYARKNISLKEKKNLHDILDNYDKDKFKDVKNIVINSGAAEYVFKLALAESDKAKNELCKLFPRSKYLDIACVLSDFVVNRKY
ncbi:MAG TPA: polyprenyl synthetase family protein [Candidatus Azoamicus sp. OHIO1]